MEINIIANRNCIIKFVNDFLTSNHLIFFHCSNYEKEGFIWGDILDIKDFINRDILINIGSKADFEQKIKRKAFSHAFLFICTNYNPCLQTVSNSYFPQASKYRPSDFLRYSFSYSSFPQHFLYFLPLPQGQGSFRPTFFFF